MIWCCCCCDCECVCACWCVCLCVCIFCKFLCLSVCLSKCSCRNSQNVRHMRSEKWGDQVHYYRNLHAAKDSTLNHALIYSLVILCDSPSFWLCFSVGEPLSALLDEKDSTWRVLWPHQHQTGCVYLLISCFVTAVSRSFIILYDIYIF